MEEEIDPSIHYVAYLLRLWIGADPDGAVGQTVWRASLEAPLTHEKHLFTAPAALVAFLHSAGEKAPVADNRSHH